MSKDVNDLLQDYKLDQIHSNTLFSLKAISEQLGIWDNYSNDEKYRLENITSSDSNLNKHFQYDGTYITALKYGEITRKGIDTLIDKIFQYKKITDKDVFVDIGSGCGKAILHIALKSDIKTLVGIEILEIRNKYAKYIKDQVSINKDIFLINKDIFDFDLSISTIVLISSIYFTTSMIKEIWNKLPKGCHVIISDPISECKMLKEDFTLDVSWKKRGQRYYYYIK